MPSRVDRYDVGNLATGRRVLGLTELKKVFAKPRFIMAEAEMGLAISPGGPVTHYLPLIAIS